MATIGIDLGTTNSLAAAFVDGKSVLIPNQFGDYLTPSVVHIDQEGNAHVGLIAKERLISQPKRTAALFKRAMGTNKSVKLGRKKFTPIELSSLVIRQLCADAEDFLGEPVDEAVISVPAYFDVSQRSATKQAGALAGIKVKRLVAEPSAAALSYHEQGVDEALVVFDFGGGTLDVSVVDCFDNVVGVSAVSGDNHLGGSDFDLIIASELCRANGIALDDLDPASRESVLRTAETAKRALGTCDEVELASPLPTLGTTTTLTEARFFELAKPLFERMKRPLKQAVYDSDIPSEEIAKIVLVGGSCHLPLVQRYLRELLNAEVVNSGDCDYAVARGLGTYVGIKQREAPVRNLVLTDVCPFSLSTSTHNPNPPYLNLSSVLIERNTILPTSVTRTYYTAESGQTAIMIEVFQGENLYAKDNTRLCGFDVKVPRGRVGSESVELTYTYDINAILAVEAKVVSTGKVKRMVHTGDGWSDDKRLDGSIEQVKLAVASDVRTLQHDCAVDRALRIAAESNEETRLFLARLLAEYEHAATTNSLRIATERTHEFNATLDAIEALKDSDDLFWKWDS